MSAESSTDLNHPILNLSPDEKRAFSFLFNQADSDQLGVVTGERAVAFFERTKVSPNVLGEIWQIADTENRGLLTKPGFCMVLRLIGHYQAGREPSAELAFKPGPVPNFDGLQIPGIGPAALPSPTGGQFPANALQPQVSGAGPIRVPPLDLQKVQQYSGLFERSGAHNGMLDGVTAKSIFERAGLPNEVLGKIWNLSDRQQRGALDQTEFIVAMHLLTSMKSRTMSALPNNLPQGLYDAAARRGAPPPPGPRGSFGAQGAIPRQFTGGSAGTPARTQSPLARTSGFGTPPAPQPPQQVQPTGTPWLVTAQQKAKYDQFFASVDTQGRGVLTGEQAVQFFSSSGLPEDSLAAIWDLADIKSEGQLNRDEFAVAMYLIGQQRGGNPAPLPAFLPPALVPPSMRQQQQQPQSTAPAFDNANNTSVLLPKSAADDLFGLDEPSPPAPVQQPQNTGFQSMAPGLQAQTTGTSTSRDPFGSVPASPSSPQRFQAQPLSANTMFKPFMPTSAFGNSIVQQHTGGSMSSSQRGFQPQQPTHPSHLHTATTAEDDLLGDNDTHAEEASKITNDTTELANMSSQIGNLRSQMETTQTKKAATQADVNATQTQKRDLELRLQQFRSQYETEVRAVKELETQLTASRESTKKLSQELAMLEGTYQDLQTQHSQVSQQLQADQQENATLKQKISQLNAEVTQLKPQIEKMKLDARQQKGLVSINKKQLATNEGERDRLQGEKTGLEREAAEREEAARNAPAESESHFGRNTAFGAAGLGAAGAAAFGTYEAVKDRQTSGSEARSPPPASGTLSPNNPFFRKPSAEGTAERAVSPPPTAGGGPTPSAFDALFGPAAAFAPAGQSGSRSGTPPVTSFGGRNVSQPSGGDGPSAAMTGSVQSVSSAGEPTPSATPPLSEQAKESPVGPSEHPPPPPEIGQFTPAQLPLGPLTDRTREDPEVSSTRALPPASHAGGIETPREMESAPPFSPGPEGQHEEVPNVFTAHEDEVPGAFPAEPEQSSSTTREVASSEQPTPAPVSTRGNDDFDSAFAGFGGGEKSGAADGEAKNDFDSVFTGFDGGDKAREAPKDEYDPFAPSSSQQPPAAAAGRSEFPPIQSLEPESDESSDEDDDEDEDERHNNLAGAASPPPPGHGAAEPTPQVLSAAKHALPEANIAGARPSVQTVDSTASAVPSLSAQQSPPTYEQSDEPSHGGAGARSGSNQFPREFGGLLPSREDPTSPQSPPAEPTETAISEEKENERPAQYSAPERSGTGSSSLYPNTVPQTPNTSDVFHDAFSRPISSVTDTYATPPTAAQAAYQQAPKGSAFDDFDEFDDLAEAKEADKSGPSDFDFGFGAGRQSADGFNPAFDSPAASTTNTMASAQQTPVPSAKQLDGFSNFQPSSNNGSNSSPFDSAGAAAPQNSSIQNTPQNVQHDWDAIFSGLDGNKAVDTSFGESDPWGASPAAAPATNGAATADRTPTAASPVATSSRPAQVAQQMGRAITPGTEHDDPILKRLTGMGWPRNDALKALEMYDYDINMAVDHLTKG
ncbi:hypothetical protein LTR22_018877 [Elasticomyces elasticus]|nr:hypothetical protein LTR22_018877 [Elasticomyces elasticus]KAK4912112.1 hypothetical protein LTR49_019398 [Elasticomyces elasticus]KAK5753642.1 hypothetical protein LTS12_016279 [Elasticomyces elasticus]